MVIANEFMWGRMCWWNGGAFGVKGVAFALDAENVEKIQKKEFPVSFLLKRRAWEAPFLSLVCETGNQVAQVGRELGGEGLYQFAVSGKVFVVV